MNFSCLRASMPVCRGLVVASFLSSPFAAESAPPIAVVARTEVQAPSEAAGITFRQFRGFEIGSDGNVVFGAFVGPFSTADGIWLNGGNTTVRVAKAETPAPGMPAGVRFSSLTLSAGIGPYVGDAGRTTFRGMVTTGTGGVTTDNNIGIWRGAPGALTPIYRTGTAAPDTPAGAVFSDFSNLVVNPSGQIGFQGFLKVGTGGVSSANNVGLWVDAPSSGLRLVAREGDIAPGAGGVRTFEASSGSGDAMPFTALRISNQGQIVFGGRLNDDTRGLWIGSTSGATLVALGNTQAPGAPVGATFAKNTLVLGAERSWGLSSQGNFGFQALLNTGPGGVTSANQHGLWVRIGGNVSLVAREGSQAPGLAAGVNFSNSGANPFDGVEVNDVGDLVFKANVAGPGITGSNNSAIWHGNLITLELVVREGQVAPGAPAGFVFSDLGTVRPVFNELGQFAFLADVQNTGGTQTRQGLWAWDPDLGLQKVAIQGDTIEVAPGVTRTISNLQASVDAAFSSMRALNDSGELVFQANFTDSSQAILKAQVPEPAGALLLGSGLLLLAMRRRK